MAQSLVEATKAKRLAFSDDLLDKLKHLQLEALQILREARQPPDGSPPALTVALNAIGQATSLLEMQAKLAGQLRELELNLSVNPVFVGIQNQLVAALAAWPGAQEVVRRVISEGQDGPPVSDVTPAVQSLIDDLLGDIAQGGEERQREAEERRPVSSLPEKERTVAKRQRPAAEKYQGPECRSVARLQYRCIAETSWAGLRWFPGQVVDGSRPELPYPPPNDEVWEPFNTVNECPKAEIKRPPGGLRGTVRL